MTETRLNPEEFKVHFSEYWWNRIGKWFETDEANILYGKLKKRSNDGAKIFPSHDRTFRAFKLSKGSPKAVLVGLSPYHNFGKNSRPNADGLAFSASLSKEETPSLEAFYDAMQDDLYSDANLKVKRVMDLSYLAEQNVLLLNYSFTTELGKATIHADMGLWDDFNRFLYSEVFRSECGIPFVLMGKRAQSLERYLFNLCHVIKKIEHPVMAARDHREWKHENMFTWCNEILKQNNGEDNKIYWDNDIPW